MKERINCIIKHKFCMNVYKLFCTMFLHAFIRQYKYIYICFYNKYHYIVKCEYAYLRHICRN